MITRQSDLPPVSQPKVHWRLGVLTYIVRYFIIVESRSIQSFSCVEREIIVV
jgi:hypothetical protein